MQNGNQDGVEEEDNPRHSTAFDHTSESSKHLLQVVLMIRKKGKKDSIQHLKKSPNHETIPALYFPADRKGHCIFYEKWNHKL